MNKKNITSNEIINFFYNNKPKIIWEAGGYYYSLLKTLLDNNGFPLFIFKNYINKDENTFLGIPIIKITEETIKLKYIFLDYEYVVKMI